MGAAAARITAGDFVTPPELARWRLALNGAGRIGGVRLGLEASAGGARLATSYQQVPLRVLPPFDLQGASLLYLLNPTAGLMDGDGQLVDIDAGPGCRAVIVGQSATRVHPAIRAFATQQWSVRVGPGAVLVLLPGPTIPFAGCRFYQRVSIDLAPGAHVLWGDLWLAGRYARGKASEQFRFETVVQELEVRRSGQLVYRDRFHWAGPWDRGTAAWHFGDAPACGSLFTTTAVPPELPAGTTCFPTAAGDHCYLWRGDSEAVTAALVTTALQLASHGSEQVHGPAWLSGTGELAPNHWFSVLPILPAQ